MCPQERTFFTAGFIQVSSTERYLSDVSLCDSFCFVHFSSALFRHDGRANNFMDRIQTFLLIFHSFRKPFSPIVNSRSCVLTLLNVSMIALGKKNVHFSLQVIIEPFTILKPTCKVKLFLNPSRQHMMSSLNAKSCYELHTV